MKRPSVIKPETLNSVLGNENLIILDAQTGKNAYNSYLKKHIVGARFIDLDKDLAKIGEDASLGGRHPLPPPQKFSETLATLGVKKNNHVVVYDISNGANAAARAWWMLKAIGMSNVQVLSGGLQAAEKEGVELTARKEFFDSTIPEKTTGWKLPTATIEEVEEGLKNGSATVIDVRDAFRYRGKLEPIDLIAGHIPGADNIPFSENLDKTGMFLKPEILREKYSSFLKNKPEDLIIHCGSGVTACHTILAMNYAGLEIPKLYVGSWSEWSRTNRAVAVEN